MTLLVDLANLGCRIKGLSLIAEQGSSTASWRVTHCVAGKRITARLTKVILNSSFRPGTNGRN
jgi:hypothetical protein